MKINSPRQFKKTFLATLLVAICLAAGVSYLYFYKRTGADQPDTSHVQQTQVTEAPSETATSESTQNKDATSTKTSGDSKELTPSQTEQASEKPIAPEITRTNYENSTVTVVAIFRTTANGTCKLELRNPNQPSKYSEANITVGPSYYLCVFSVNDVTGSGWTAHVVHVNNGVESDPDMQKIN